MQELEKILEEIDKEIAKERAICEDLEDTPCLLYTSYNGDMVYEINGLSVCEDCIGDYIRSLGKELS